MCQISKIDRDWIDKGLHIHVFGVELVMRPDHQRGIIFKKFFRSTTSQEAAPAITRANELLGELSWRGLFRRELIRARPYLHTERGKLRELANGRAFEFTMLIHALERMGVT